MLLWISKYTRCSLFFDWFFFFKLLKTSLFIGYNMHLRYCLSVYNLIFCLFYVFVVHFFDFLMCFPFFIASICSENGRKCNFFFVTNLLSTNRGIEKVGKKRKKILVVWKMVVFLHSLSPREGDVEKGKRKDIEKVETRDSVCRRFHCRVRLRTRKSQR